MNTTLKKKILIIDNQLDLAELLSDKIFPKDKYDTLLRSFNLEESLIDFIITKQNDIDLIIMSSGIKNRLPLMEPSSYQSIEVTQKLVKQNIKIPILYWTNIPLHIFETILNESKIKYLKCLSRESVVLENSQKIAQKIQKMLL